MVIIQMYFQLRANLGEQLFPYIVLCICLYFYFISSWFVLCCCTNFRFRTTKMIQLSIIVILYHWKTYWRGLNSIGLNEQHTLDPQSHFLSMHFLFLLSYLGRWEGKPYSILKVKKRPILLKRARVRWKVWNHFNIILYQSIWLLI